MSLGIENTHILPLFANFASIKYEQAMRTINLKEVDDKARLTYHDNNIALINSLGDQLFIDDKFLIDGVVMVIIQNGRIDFTVQQQHFEMHSGDMFLCRPRNILENTMLSADLQIKGCFLSIPFAQRIIDQTDFDILQLSITVQHHVIHLTQEQQDTFWGFLELLSHILKMPNLPHKDKAVNSIFHTLSYLFADLAIEVIKPVDELVDGRKFTSGELLVKKFIQMLADPQSRTRSVYEYSNRLNVSAKYFSTICKTLTGHTASQIINDTYVHEARALIRNPAYSIKQIADMLGFKNQSHFGSFMRRNTGKSPNALRTE